MRVMLDLNVLLDVVQRREPFYAASAAALSRVIEGPDAACLPGHALTSQAAAYSRSTAIRRP